MNQDLVVIQKSVAFAYPSSAPFHPGAAYPEYALGTDLTRDGNAAYDAVREALRLSGLDAARYGTPAWNPLGAFIRPGQFVLLKPNLVKESHPRDPEGWVYTITHGSVIRAVADYVWKSLDGRGRVAVGDAPQTDSSFSQIVRLLQLDRLRDFYRAKGLEFELIDFRKEEWTAVEEVIVDRIKLPGDPRGAVAFDLADRSEFVGHGGAGRYYGADYDATEVNRHHTGGRHEYLISGSAIECDVFVNIPKLKTHKKAGITVNLKNLVGINADKNWLPHHTVGSPRDGGDQFPDQSLARRIEHFTATQLRSVALRVPGLGTWLLRRARRVGKQVFGDHTRAIRSGNWWGNDTTWRMCLDLNKVLLYGNADGSLRDPLPAQRKPYLCFVDGLIGGQGNGPMDPDPLEAGVVLFGCNPAAVDAVAAVLMGFDINRLPIVKHAFEARGFPLVPTPWHNLQCLSNHASWVGDLGTVAEHGDLLRVRPHFGWVGHIESRRGARNERQSQ